MIAYAIRRIALMVPTLLAIMVVNFFIVQAAPGGPIEQMISKLKGGVRGKYLSRYRAGTNLALLAPDVRAAFPTDEAVNQALRAVMQSQNAQ